MSDQVSGDAGQTLAAAPCSAVAARYAWRDENILAGFETWDAEIAHMENLGYKLVAPEYKVPHWAEAMRAGESLTTLYILGLDGPRELRTHLDCYAANVGYPLFYQPNDKLTDGGRKTHE